MRRINHAVITIVVFLASVLAITFTAMANIGGFTVTPVMPENQNPQTQGFFDLNVTAGQQQEISVIVGNTGNEEISVEVSLFTANTNRNGIVDYTMPGQSDITLAHSFSDIASLPAGHEHIVIPAGQNVSVPIIIDIPEEGFEGIMLGSLHVLLGITEEERAAAGMIVNRFANVIVVMLRENDTPVAPDFLLGDVGAGIVNYRAAIVAEVRNPQPRLTTGVRLDARIYPSGGDAPIFETSNLSVDFAPNTVFQLSMIDDAGFGLQPGSYMASIHLEHEGLTWDFEREFEIVPAQATDINRTAVNIQQQMPMVGGVVGGGGSMMTWMTWMIIAAGVLLVTAVVAFVVFRSRTPARAKLSEPAMADFQLRMEQRMKQLEHQSDEAVDEDEMNDPYEDYLKQGKSDKEKALEKLQQMDQDELMLLMEQAKRKNIDK